MLTAFSLASTSGHGSRAINGAARLIGVVVAVFALLFPTLALPQADAQESTGTLTIIKHVGEGEFEQLQNPQPLSGVTFRVDKLKDLTPQSQLQLGAIAKENPYLLTSDSSNFASPAVTAKATTGADGRATFASLPEGVYLVQEEPYRTGNVQYSAITPFLISIPDAKGNRDIEVKAKNQPVTAEKFVNVEQTSAGNIATFNIRSSVPAPDTRGKLYQMIIRDDLDSRLSLAADPIVTIANGQQSRRLAKDTDYMVKYNPDNGQFSVEFTQDGLAKLAEMRTGHPETQVEVAIATKIQDGLPAGTSIDNTAYVFPDGWPTDVLDNFLTHGISTNEANIIVHGVSVTPKPTAPVAPMLIWPVFPALTWPDFKPCPNCAAASAVTQPPLIDQIINKVTGAQGQDQNKPRLERLASTGASVIGLVIVALLLLLVGWWLLVWRRKKDEDDETEQGVSR